MKQLLRIKKDILLKEIPMPQCGDHEVLIATQFSLLLPELEKQIMRGNSAFKKLLHEPELFDFMLRKIHKEGLHKTLAFGKAMMSNWHTLGCMIVGKVVQVGSKVKDIKIGERVVASGWHIANHAEYNAVPHDLVAHLPDDYEPQQALLSIYAAKLLALLDSLKLKKDNSIMIFGSGVGTAILKQILLQKNVVTEGKADYIFIVHNALDDQLYAKLTPHLHEKSKIILAWEKELDKNYPQVSKYNLFLSDRKLHFEDRSLLEKLEQKQLDATLKIKYSHTLETKSFADAASLYEHKSPLILSYGSSQNTSTTIEYFNMPKPAQSVGIALIGVGNIARAVHIPILKSKKNVFIKYVFSKSGRTAASMADYYKIPYATSSYEQILQDTDITIVAILTHHSTHALYASQALAAGKHVFMEKPLCLNEKEAQLLLKSCSQHTKFSLGFNKTFSPLAKQLKEIANGRKHPFMLVHRLQAPLNPGKPWYYDPAVGGGRLIGEYCHLFDFACWLSGTKVKNIQVSALQSKDPYLLPESNVDITLSFEDGSVATLICSEDGNIKAPKERIELIMDNTVAVIEDWEKITINGHETTHKMNKGYEEHWDALLTAVSGKEVELVNVERAAAVMKLCFEADRIIHQRAKNS